MAGAPPPEGQHLDVTGLKGRREARPRVVPPVQTAEPRAPIPCGKGVREPGQVLHERVAPGVQGRVAPRPAEPVPEQEAGATPEVREKAAAVVRPRVVVAVGDTRPGPAAEGVAAEGEGGKGVDKATGETVIEAMGPVPKGQNGPERERTATAEDPATGAG